MEETKNNEVVLERIDGLVKVTDVRFSNVEKTLERIEINNQTYATKNELEETKKDFNAAVKRIEEAQTKHNADDIVSFEKLAIGQRQTRDTILKWIGALTIISVCLPLLSPLLIHYFFKI